MSTARSSTLDSAFTLSHFRRSARAGEKLAMLTAYDYTTAKLLARSGVKLLLAGDSAANVILGHPSTLPAPLDFMIEITAAVKRAAPNALVMADMPFGSFATLSSGVRNVVRMVKLSGCDCVKLEATRGHIGLVQALADNGVAAFAHLGLMPQSVGILGGYRAQGRTAIDAMQLADLATDFVNAGAAGILLEAVPPPAAELVVKQVNFVDPADDPTGEKFVPVIGCGAGPACHAHVVVTHDLLGLSDRQPRFAPPMVDAASVVANGAQKFVQAIATGKYPAKNHCYEMPASELKELKKQAAEFGVKIG
jgi:3-methyl-2-oxobutanoate hydroxymethyltransferase